jgi:uncharacterized protein (DUF1697 family)
MKYVVLLRGINVGGKNIVPMSGLKKVLGGLGFSDVSTWIASGNVILESDRSVDEIKTRIEEAMPHYFELDDENIKVLVLPGIQLRSVVQNKPRGFGEYPEKYHSDIIFLMGVDPVQAMTLFNPREGVDSVWPGLGVVYSQRLSAQRTKSRLNKIMMTAEYKSMTIRTWATITRLLEMLEK